MKTNMCKLIATMLIIFNILLIAPPIEFSNFEANAVDSNIANVDMSPILSSPVIDINNSITVKYENINFLDYEVECLPVGIEASLIEEDEYIEIEIRGISTEDFGTLTVNAIADDGTSFSDILYTYNNGYSLHVSDLGKDQALYQGIKEMYDMNTEDYVVITEEECAEIYSAFSSNYIKSNGILDVILGNETTSITGFVYWETSGTPRSGETENPNLPMRNAKIEVGVKILDRFVPVGSGYTDESGKYDIIIEHSNILNGSDLYIRVKLEALTFFVATDWFFDHYYYEAKILEENIEAGTCIEAKDYILEYDTNTLLYKATYVHQAMVIGERFASKMGMQTDRIVRVAYPGGILNSTVDDDLEKMAFCGGNIFNSSYSVIGKDSYNNTQMIVHEYSHYVQMSLGNYGATLIDIATYGPGHEGDLDDYKEKKNKKFATHLTWSESWGYTFSIMAQRYYQNEYKELAGTNYHTSITTTGSFLGEFQEQTVIAFLWSLIDLAEVKCEDNKEQADEETTAENTEEDAEEAILDYVLPWTPQEWWNMTTVSGTCRFPDFIELLESESYNLGVDIDYEKIKEYIAEKLMTYNIAPEIKSITFAQSNLREVPIITFIPNGSSSYPNNMISVRIMNSDGEILAETERVSINAGNLSEYIFGDDDDERAIMQAAWDIALEASPCSSSVPNTTLKISVLGYRYDEKEENGTDIEEEFQLTGPYYSKYNEVSVVIPHEYEYVRIDNEYHSMTCVDCGYSEVFGHVADPSYTDPLGKFAQCRYCGTLYRIIGFTPIIKNKIPEEIAIE